MSTQIYWLVLTALLTSVLWIPYVLERIFRVGLFNAMGYSSVSGVATIELNNEKPPAWAIRAQAAHRNAIENFVLFATLMLVSEFIVIHTTSVIHITSSALATQVYFFSRVTHFLAYVLAVPYLRTLSYFVSFGAMLSILINLLTA